MTAGEFASYYREWREPIQRMAWRLAAGDCDLAEDLEQEALCALAAFDLGMVETNEAGCLRAMLYRRMCNVRRAELRARRIPAWTPMRPSRARQRARRSVDIETAGHGALPLPACPAVSTDGTRCRGTRRRPPQVVQRPRVPRHWDAAPWSEES